MNMLLKINTKLTDLVVINWWITTEGTGTSMNMHGEYACIKKGALKIKQTEF